MEQGGKADDEEAEKVKSDWLPTGNEGSLSLTHQVKTEDGRTNDSRVKGESPRKNN